MASVELKNSPRLLTIHIQKAKYDAILRHKSVVLKRYSGHNHKNCERYSEFQQRETGRFKH
jgi:hypothetical protein